MTSCAPSIASRFSVSMSVRRVHDLEVAGCHLALGQAVEHERVVAVGAVGERDPHAALSRGRSRGPGRRAALGAHRRAVASRRPSACRSPRRSRPSHRPRRGGRALAAGAVDDRRRRRARRSGPEVGFQRDGRQKRMDDEEQHVGLGQVHDRRTLHDHRARGPAARRTAPQAAAAALLLAMTQSTRARAGLRPGGRCRSRLAQRRSVLDDPERHVDVADDAGRAARAALEHVVGGRELHAPTRCPRGRARRSVAASAVLPERLHGAGDAKRRHTSIIARTRGSRTVAGRMLDSRE